MIESIPLFILSYLIGSIPTSILVGKIYKRIDIRDYGSGNAGATNTFRVLGRKAGVIVMAVDVAKGFTAAFFIPKLLIFSFLGTLLGTSSGSAIDGSGIVPIICLCAAVIGHMFPLFARFKGGKGVGTGAGGIFGLDPLAASVCLLTFLLTLFVSGYVSLSSIIAACMLPVISLVVMLVRGNGIDIAWMVFSILIAVLIIGMHRTNIKRLMKGEESRFEKMRLLKRKEEK